MLPRTTHPETIIHGKYKIKGLPHFHTLLDLNIKQVSNKHAELTIRGYGNDKELTDAIISMSFGDPIEIFPVLDEGANDDKPIFAGVLVDGERIDGNRVNIFEFKALSGSILLDLDLKSRSFQDVSKTYADVVDAVLSDTPGGFSIASVGTDTPIGRPLIQYRETDWQFIKRIASHFNSPIIPNISSPKPWVYFGLHKHGDDRKFDDTYFECGVSENYHKEHGKANGFIPLDFKYYKVRSHGNFFVGDNADIGGVNLKICERIGKLINSELVFEYTLGLKEFVSVKCEYNNKINGMSLKGTVVKTEKELVNILLDIDGANGGSEYQYTWRPTSGNIMYCMPQLGTVVSLLLPNHDEREAIATNSPRANGATIAGNQAGIAEQCANMTDYQKRIFTTEHDKIMYLYPESMGLIGTSPTDTQLAINMIDEEQMQFKSHNEIIITAKEAITLKAPMTIFKSPRNINLIKTPYAATFSVYLQPIGTHLLVPMNGETVQIEVSDMAEVFLELAHRFDLRGYHGVAQGWDFVLFPPFDDAPTVGQPERPPRIRRFLGGLLKVAVAAIAIAVVVKTGGAALVVFAAKAKAAGGVVAAAKTVAIGGFKGLATKQGAAQILKKAAFGGATSAGMQVASDLIADNDITLNNVVRAFVVGAVSGAVPNPVVGSLAGSGVDYFWSTRDGSYNVNWLSVAIGVAAPSVLGGIGRGLGAGGRSFAQTSAGRALSRAGNSAGNVLTAPTRWFGKNTGFGRWGQNRLVNHPRCQRWWKRIFDPVDAVTGSVVYELVDFEYPGIIPLVWERHWNSGNTDTLGDFGYGSSFLLSMTLEELEREIVNNADDEQNGVSGIERILAFTNEQGTKLPLPILEVGESYVERLALMTLHRLDEHVYEIFNHDSRLYYRFEMNKSGNKYLLIEISTETRDHKISVMRNTEGHLAKVTDTAGREFNINTNKTGQVTSVSLAGKTLVNYEYDDILNLIKVTDANKHSSAISYNNHLMTKRVTKNGDTFQWEYDGDSHTAKCIHTWGDNNLLKGHLEYFDDHTVTTNSLGHTKVFYFDENFLLTCIKNANGHDMTWEYNEYAELVALTNEDGEVTKFDYNEFGQEVEVTLQAGGTQKSEFDEHSRLVKTISPLGAETAWEYNDAGRLEKTILPNEAVMTYEYNDRGLVSTVSELGTESEDALITKLAYDNHLNVISIIYPTGAEVKREYDTEGNCTKVINPMGATQTMSYDAGNRISELIDADGKISRLKYNGYGDVVELNEISNPTSINIQRRKVSFAYTPFGKLTSRLEDGSRIRLTYDTEDRLKEIENEAGEKYFFERDNLGNVIIETGYDNVRRSYSYSRAGKLTGIKRGNTAKWTDMKYDAGGNLAEIRYEDGDTEYFTHGKAGELLSAENQYSKLSFEYDLLGNLVNETQNGYTVSREYSRDNIGALTSLKTSLGLNVDIGLGQFGQAEEITASFGSAEYKSKMSYNSVGQMVERVVNLTGTSKLQDTWSYDSVGRPTQQSISIDKRESSRRQYQWENGDQIKSIIDSISNMGVEYSYSAQGNPEVEKFKNTTFSMKRPERDIGTSTIRHLDKTGKVHDNKSGVGRKYAAGGQLLESKMRKYEYNDCGDLIKKTERDGRVWQYSYAVGGLLEKVIRPDNKEVTFIYDPIGRRISKAFDGKTTKYVWNGDTIVHEWVECDEQAGQGQADTSPLETERTPQNVQTWLYENGTFTPLAKLTENNSYAVITDHLGTPKKLIGQDGKVAWGATLDIFGLVRSIEGNDTQEANCNLRFPGQFEDEETGLYYNRFRYYMPGEGVYTQRDPIGLAGGNPTVYGYAYNTLLEFDPFGLNIYTRTTWRAPSNGTGFNYTVFQRNIDWDLIVPSTGQTNLQTALAGRAPHIDIGNGRTSPINLHHSQQNAKGSLFELPGNVHSANTSSPVLHPHRPGKHPHNPVDHRVFKIDRERYWIERGQAEVKRRNAPSGGCR